MATGNKKTTKKNALPKSSNHTVMLSIFLTIGYVNFYGHFEQNLDVDYTRESENSLELYMTKNPKEYKVYKRLNPKFFPLITLEVCAKMKV